MAVAAKPKKKSKKHPVAPVSFKNLLNRVLNHEKATSLIKTAVQTGWLTDEDFLTKMTDSEIDQVREVYNSESAYKRAPVGDPTKALLPSIVGPMADDDGHIAGERARLTSGEKTIFVDARLYLTMKKRHPNACVYLPRDDQRSAVTFSEKTTVAVLPVLID